MRDYLRNALGILIIILYFATVACIVYALWHFLAPQTYWQKLVMLLVDVIVAMVALSLGAYPTTWALEKLGFC